MSAGLEDNRIETRQPSGDCSLVAVVAVFLACMIYSAVRTPVPAVNEPHYLTKAMHYWDPDFCRGDFFLEAPNAHVVFYQTFGLMTRWLTLEHTAWIGRAVALALLAWGWCSLISQLLPGRWAGFWTACIYLSLAAIGQASRLVTFDDYSLRILDLSGEWIVGGIEGKVHSYAFAFWGMGLWLVGRRYRAALCAGLAISFHPIVGVWSVAAGCFATAVTSLGATDGKSLIENDLDFAKRRPQPRLRQTTIVLALLVAAALPGLLPALKFVGGGDAKVENDSAYIQVAYRLAHHLDPMDIPWTAYASYAVMAAFWLVVRRRVALKPPERWFTWFVVGSMLFCLIGVLLGWRSGDIAEMPSWQLRTRLLKFYWFRLADVMVPLAASVGVVAILQACCARAKSASSLESCVSRRPVWVINTALSALLAGSLFLPSADRDPSEFDTEKLADWKDACRWIAAETPDDAIFLTPTYGWGFKWYAGRAEFVTYKDVPQDAASTVEWNNRLIALADWTRENRNEFGSFSPAAVARLRGLCEKHQPGGIDYIVAVDGLLGPFELRPTYENKTCRVYRLTDSPPKPGKDEFGR